MSMYIGIHECDFDFLLDRLTRLRSKLLLETGTVRISLQLAIDEIVEELERRNNAALAEIAAKAAAS